MIDFFATTLTLSNTCQFLSRHLREELGADDLNRVVELTLAFISSSLFFSSAFSLRSLIASCRLPQKKFSGCERLIKRNKPLQLGRFLIFQLLLQSLDGCSFCFTSFPGFP